MTPRPTKGRAAARDATQARNGVSDADLIAKYKDFQLPVVRYVTVSSLKKHDQVRNEVDSLLRQYKPKVHGQVVTSWCDLVEKKLAFPSIKFIATVILNRAKTYEKNRQRVNKEPHVGHLETFWITFCAVWNFAMPLKVTKEERARGRLEARNIGASRKFSTNPRRKPIVTLGSLQDILRGIWTTAFEDTLESRLNVVTYLALSTCTAGRPGSFLRPCLGTVDETVLERSDVDPHWMALRAIARKKMTGAQFHQFQLHLLPPAESGQTNRLVGFYRSSWAKNDLSKGKWFMLLPGPTYGTSPCVMLLVTLVVRNLISVDDLRHMLDPATIGTRTNLRITLPTAARQTHVLRTRRGRPCTTRWMTERLTTLSQSLGFRHPWTAYTPRHLGGQSMRRTGVSIADVRATLRHHKNSIATAAYEAPTAPFSAWDAMSGKNLVTNHDGLGTDMRSTSDAPVTLTAEELEEIERLAEKEVRAAQNSLVAPGSAVTGAPTASSSDAATPFPSAAATPVPSTTAPPAASGSQGSSTSESAESLPAKQIRTARNRLTKRKLADLREAHFSGGSHPKKPRPVETTAAHFRAFVWEEWFTALDAPLTQPPDKLCAVLESLFRSGKSAEASGSGGKEVEEEDVSDNESVDEEGMDMAKENEPTRSKVDERTARSSLADDEDRADGSDFEDEWDESEFEGGQEDGEDDGEDIRSDDDDEDVDDEADLEWTYRL